MSIKSDRWIRRMAAAHGMIEPFSEQQVRVANGHKIVSYGTSSYGYDVRCADDFKIFTNINSTIVDPKAFDEKSFVDFKGPVCIIPPNSFALASTVEYFRIPRSVLTVCLGKCVTGDTRVVDAETGAYVPITEMRFGKSTLALDADSGKLKPAKVSAFVPQGRKEIFELRTRAGLSIRATANHPFLTFDGWTALSELRAGDRIAAAGSVPVFGKTPIPDSEASQFGAMIAQGQFEQVIPQAIFTAPENSVRLFLESLLRGLAAAPEGTAVAACTNSGGYSHPNHGISDQKCGYSHPNLYRFQRSSAVGTGGSVAVDLPPVDSALGSDEGALTEYFCRSRRLAEDIHHLLLRFATSSMIREMTADDGTLGWTIQISNPGQVNGHVWDVVAKIESVGEDEVFDISVPNLHNFLANDLIVHNSTYARCFRGDTRVALVDDTSPTLEEMARRHESGELFWGYSIGQHGRMIVSLLDAPRFIGRDSLLEIELDSGEKIHATPDHIFMRRDGRMTAAHELRPNDALMPLYRDLVRGYEEVYQPIDGYMYATHRLADEWNLRNKIYEEMPGSHRHHMDFDRRNNRPTNIVRLDASEHIRLHNSETYGEGFDAEGHGDSIRIALANLAANPQWREEFSRAQSERAAAFWGSDKYEEIRSRLIELRRNPTDATREAHRKATLLRYTDPAERARHSRLMRQAWAADDGTRRGKQAEIARRIKLREEISEQSVRRALDDAGSIRGAAALLNCDRSVFRRFPEALAKFRGTPAYRNHKVVAIRELPGDHDVYCLTVPEAGNFALEAGVFVKNCGIIVNVTPLEPEWEGHVTLEFSNTTPLPAKIYANEGVAQMLFFESDEICETSYKDRGGKYQGQRGVTLPKT
jgi:deoxycytidine triphosphate deaminase